MKADRLPRWQVRRLSGEHRAAYDRLCWQSSGPAERARLKKRLGWRRTSEETLALLEELLAEGLVREAIRAALGVSDRHFRRLLAERTEQKSETPENGAANPHGYAAETDITCKPGPDARAVSPVAGFASFAELDRWLDRNGAA